MYEKRTVVIGVLALVSLVVFVLLYNAFIVTPYLFVSWPIKINYVLFVFMFSTIILGFTFFMLLLSRLDPDEADGDHAQKV